MKESFGELLDAVRKNRKYDPWAQKISSQEYCKALSEESQEIMEAIKNKDNLNLTEEIGDLLWDVIMFSVIAEEEGTISTKEIIKTVLEKMKERKPHIFEERVPSKEEAKKAWFDAKARQKARKGDVNAR